MNRIACCRLMLVKVALAALLSMFITQVWRPRCERANATARRARLSPIPGFSRRRCTSTDCSHVPGCRPAAAPTRNSGAHPLQRIACLLSARQYQG